MQKRFTLAWLAFFSLCLFLNACAFSSASQTKERAKPEPLIPLSALEKGVTYGEPKPIGTITDRQLAEVSGLAPSQTAKGAWWVHNDSGDQPRLYAVNSQGQLIAKFTVAEAKNVDWEDMARGPNSTLFIADTGNNSLSRSELTLYRVAEPNLGQASSRNVLTGDTAAAEAFPYRYPDGKHDAEALFVDPQSGRPYLVTKKMSPPCAVYRFPLPLQPGKLVTLEKVTGKAVKEIAQLALVTGATVSPDGKRLAIRTYFTALELTRNGGTFEAIFDSQPQTIKIPLEQQGEAISYSADGKSLVTTSEKIPAPLFRLTRISP